MDYEVLTCEGCGPSGVAIIVDTLTDNKNRTATNIRSKFIKGGGNAGKPGSMSYMLDKKARSSLIRKSATWTGMMMCRRSAIIGMNKAGSKIT